MRAFFAFAKKMINSQFKFKGLMKTVQFFQKLLKFEVILILMVEVKGTSFKCI